MGGIYSMIKLIALDLDGTLLNSEKNISEVNKEAIRKAKEKGVKIVLCTGRPLLGIERYLEELNLLEEGDYSITYNGGLVQKNNTGEILLEKTLSLENINELHQMGFDLGIPMNMIDLECVYEPEYPEGRESLYQKLQSANLPFLERNITEFSAGHTFNKVVYCTAPDILEEAINNIPAAMKERYSMMRSRPVLYEVMHPEVNKGKGIESLCQLLGFTKENVMACGDEENDLAMLTYAGLPVAMENASESVKEFATFISKTNDEDGVAHAINKFVL